MCGNVSVLFACMCVCRNEEVCLYVRTCDIPCPALRGSDSAMYSKMGCVSFEFIQRPTENDLSALGEGSLCSALFTRGHTSNILLPREVLRSDAW